MISGEIMRSCKVKRILQYHMPNKLLSPEEFTQEFPSFTDSKELLSSFLLLYQNKLQG